MENNPELPPSPEMRGEYLDTLKSLARDQFIQREMGTIADFEKLWADAFSLNRTSGVPSSEF